MTSEAPHSSARSLAFVKEHAEMRSNDYAALEAAKQEERKLQKKKRLHRIPLGKNAIAFSTNPDYFTQI